jgi:proteasome accessory factor B
MSRIERLVNLTAALLATERSLTADEIRERVPGYPEDKLSFRRQFERDKEALRELGLPLMLETVGAGSEEQPAYRIDSDQYYLRDPGLTPDELSALHLASRMVRVEGLSAGDGMWKLAADRLDALDRSVRCCPLTPPWRPSSRRSPRPGRSRSSTGASDAAPSHAAWHSARGTGT